MKMNFSAFRSASFCSSKASAAQEKNSMSLSSYTGNGACRAIYRDILATVWSFSSIFFMTFGSCGMYGNRRASISSNRRRIRRGDPFRPTIR